MLSILWHSKGFKRRLTCSKSQDVKMLNVQSAYTNSPHEVCTSFTIFGIFLEYFWNFPKKNSRTRRLLIVDGASNQDRTDDPRFTRAVLYQLSYAGVQKRANNYTGKPCIIQAEILKKPENTTNKALKIICVLLRCLLNTLMRSSVSSSWVCCKR